MAEETMTRNYPKKITTAMIGLGVEVLQDYAEKNGKRKPVAVCNVFGRVRKTSTEQSQYGPYTRYNGEFEAINLLDNTSHRSRVLILPQVAETALDEQVGSVKQSDPEAVVEFGLVINVQYYNNPNKTGTRFRFGVNPLGQPSNDDALSQIGQRFGAIPSAQIEEKKGKK